MYSSLVTLYLLFVEMESLLLKPYSGQTFADKYIELPEEMSISRNHAEIWKDQGKVG